MRFLPCPVQALTHLVESLKTSCLVPDLAPQLDRFLQSTQPDREPSSIDVEETEVCQRPGRVRPFAAGGRKRIFEPLRTFCDLQRLLPEPAECTGELEVSRRGPVLE